MALDNLWQHSEAEDDTQEHATTTWEGIQQREQRAENVKWQQNAWQNKTPRDNSE